MLKGEEQKVLPLSLHRERERESEHSSWWFLYNFISLFLPLPLLLKRKCTKRKADQKGRKGGVRTAWTKKKKSSGRCKEGLG